MRNILLENVNPGCQGGGTAEQARREVPEREASYPESTMFGTLPAYGFYCRHVQGLTSRRLTLRTETAGLRPAMVFDDVRGPTLDALDPSCWPGGEAVLRMIGVEEAAIRGAAPSAPVGTWLRIEGKTSQGVVLEANDLAQINQVVDRASEVDPQAVTVRP